jgi:nicotinate-nucleotide adenylyltransferase
MERSAPDGKGLKAGLLGGTFDPVHNAHLAMARAARDVLKLDKILFMPTGTPRYRRPAQASGEHRVAMLQLALENDKTCEIDARELAPGASGYTVDTLRELRLEHGPETPIWLLLGADQYSKLDTWHRPEDVKRLARIAVFARPGIALDKSISLVPMDLMPISASEIRARVARGDDISGLVPPAVADYIARHRLYA